MLIGDARSLAGDIINSAGDGAVLIVVATLAEAAVRLSALASQLQVLPTANGQLLDLQMNLSEHRILWQGRKLEVTVQEFRLLECLTTERRVWSFDELTQQVCGARYLGDRGPLHSAVKRLRRKLISAETDFDIESVRGIGFRLVDSNKPSLPRAT